ncbi:MAG: translation elongation factor EF-1 subunit alpha [archaeon]
MANKLHMNLIFIGHVDHGKSTTVGRVLFDTGAISEGDMKKLQDKAKEFGMEGTELAYVMDSLKEERQRGMTIDLSHKKFESQKYYYTIIDAPGHRDFVKNMITGVSQADAAVLVVSCVEGPQAQTKEHIFLARTLGIKQLIIAVNKMDRETYAEAAFKRTKEAVSEFLKQIGYKVEEIKFIPISGLKGDNVVKKSTNMPWYTGPVLLEACDMFSPPEKPVDKPLRLPIQEAYTITGIGTVPVGRVETGRLKPNDTVVFMPSGLKAEVKSIEMHHEQLTEALPGDNIGFSVKGIGKNDVHRGDVVGSPNNPPTVVAEFTAQIVVLNHPTVIAKGYTPVFHAHTAQVACTVTELLKKIDPKTGQVAQENPDFIKTGDVAVIKCVPLKPFCLEKAKDFPPLGRFAIRDMGQTVAAGMVIDLVPKTG